MSSSQKTIWVITTVVLVIVGITLGVAFGIPAGFLVMVKNRKFYKKVKLKNFSPESSDWTFSRLSIAGDSVCL